MTYVSWADTSIKVLVPSGVYGLQPVTVTTAGGTSETIDIVILTPTSLVLSAIAPVQYSDQATIQARLTDVGGNPVAGKSVTFAIGTTRQVVTTDQNGYAVWTPTITLKPGSFTVSVSFTADDHYLASSTSGAMTVAAEDVDSTYTGAATVKKGKSLAMSANVIEPADSSPGDLTKISTAYFQIYDSGGNLVKTYSGHVSVSWPGVATASTSATITLNAGTYTMKVVPISNSYYEEDAFHPVALVVTP